MTERIARAMPIPAPRSRSVIPSPLHTPRLSAPALVRLSAVVDLLSTIALASHLPPAHVSFRPLQLHTAWNLHATRTSVVLRPRVRLWVERSRGKSRMFLGIQFCRLLSSSSDVSNRRRMRGLQDL